MEGFRRDLELAPGAGFRLRRRLWARLLSAFGVLGGAAIGLFDLMLGYRWAGAFMLVLAFAFAVQFVLAEVDAWRFERGEAVRRRLVLAELTIRETRIAARHIRGVHIEFAGKRARAWIETNDGAEYALVEGKRAEVTEIADRLTASLDSARRVLH